MKSTHRGVLLLVKVHFRQMSFMELFTKLLLIPFKTTVTLEFLFRSSLYSVFIYCFIYSLFTLYKHTFIQTFRGFHYVIFWKRLSAQLSTYSLWIQQYVFRFFLHLFYAFLNLKHQFINTVRYCQVRKWCHISMLHQVIHRGSHLVECPLIMAASM